MIDPGTASEDHQYRLTSPRTNSGAETSWGVKNLFASTTRLRFCGATQVSSDSTKKWTESHSRKRHVLLRTTDYPRPPSSLMTGKRRLGKLSHYRPRWPVLSQAVARFTDQAVWTTTEFMVRSMKCASFLAGVIRT
jgi:hypothetical protein